MREAALLCKWGCYAGYALVVLAILLQIWTPLLLLIIVALIREKCLFKNSAAAKQGDML